MISIDSEYDEAAKIVARWRRNHLYPKIPFNGRHHTVLKGNMATREYFSEALAANTDCFVTGSGHGTHKKFMDTSGNQLLEIRKYDKKEVRGKIIHLLSCYTADELGKDMVRNGCRAFLGYDIYFTFPVKRFHDEFMRPDQVLVLKMCEGKSVSKVHSSVIQEYESVLEEIKKQGASPQEIEVLKKNKEHFCSPFKSEVWGDPDSQLNSIF